MANTRDAIEATRKRMKSVFTPNQVLGRTRAIGCAAVEVTQRCNLDCTLCYLSEHSEDVVDIPVEEVFNRLDSIRRTFGPGTNVQITGGDPTLRKHTELVEIVEHAATIGLYPALFTNGIAASRKLLSQLAGVGLREVAFHVDTTQRRKGYRSETDLHAVRLEYMDRARGLGLFVIFNTTVHAGNFGDIADLVRLFVSHADAVGFASFQLQADTGRGRWSGRDPIVSQSNVRHEIERGLGRALPWDLARIGHPKCHSYAPTFIVNAKCYPVIQDRRLFEDFLHDFAHLHQDRRRPLWEIIANFFGTALRKPGWFLRGLDFVLTHAWQARQDLVRSHGRIHRMSFFVQNFMDAGHLDPERVAACSFMLMTADGPVSMCEHNARRDEFILQPITFHRRDGSLARYDPLPKPVPESNADRESAGVNPC